MGGAGSTPKKRASVTLDPEQSELAAKPSGTLIYFARGMRPGRRTESTIIENEEFFGLDVDYNAIEIHQLLGKGSYGEVFQAHYKGKHIAVKEILMAQVPEGEDEVLDDFRKEIKILSLLNHECIVRFLGACRKEPHFCLLFELMQGSVGSLLELVHKNKVNVTWRMCMKIARDSARAVAYLHNLTPKILHRDLKSENLLLDNSFNCKLTDFGLSRAYEPHTVMTVCGTPCWVAPEIFRGEPYSEEVDVYSFGVVLWELFAFKKPYQNVDAVELPYLVAKQNLRPDAPIYCPPSLNKLMADCWDPTAANRPNFSQVVLRIDIIMNELEALASGHANANLLADPIDETHAWN